LPQTDADIKHAVELQDNSDESDFDPEQPAPAAIQSVDPDDIQPAAQADSDSDEEPVVPALTELTMPTIRSTRVLRAPVTFKPKAWKTSCDRYNHDESFRTTRDALVNTKVRKYFPGRYFNGIITSYYPIMDTCHMLFDDGDEETDSYDNIQKFIEGTSEYEQVHSTALALTVSLDAAINGATTMTPNAKEPNHYKDAKNAPDSEHWKAARDLYMKKLRERNCWSVVKRADIHKGTRHGKQMDFQIQTR
jgi:hypothetical protein